MVTTIYHVPVTALALTQFTLAIEAESPEEAWLEADGMLAGACPEDLTYNLVNRITPVEGHPLSLTHINPRHQPEAVGWYVNVYKIDRAYGGPEEGGWWYDIGDLIQSMGIPDPFLSRAAAIAARDNLQAELDKNENDGAPPVSSVNSRGRYEAQIQLHRGRSYPSRRPHYE